MLLLKTIYCKRLPARIGNGLRQHRALTTERTGPDSCGPRRRPPVSTATAAPVPASEAWDRAAVAALTTERAGPDRRLRQQPATEQCRTQWQPPCTESNSLCFCQGGYEKY